MIQAPKVMRMIGIAAIGLALVSCEDSYVMRKLREKKQEPASRPAPAATSPQPADSSKSPAEKIPGPVAETAPSVPPSDASSGNDAGLRDKINAYVECLNRAKPRTLQSRERYLSWVNEQSGPTCKERYIAYGLYTLYEDGVQRCQSAVELGGATPPDLPKLQQAAIQLTQSFSQLVPLVQRASDYYEQEDYKDDQCAKGKEMHPQLMAAFKGFMEAADTMDAEIKPLQRQLDQKELAQLQQGGNPIQYFSKKFLMSADQILSQIPKTLQPGWNGAGYLEKFPRLETDYQELQDYLAANAEEANKVFWFNAFSMSAKNFYTQAKFLKRDLASGKKLTPNDLNKLIDQYNRMISDGNNLRF